MVAVGDKPASEVERFPKPLPAAPDAAPPPPAPALTYERGTSVTVRGFRLLVALTLVNTVLLASIVLGPQLVPFVKQQWQQWKDAREQRRKVAAELAAQQKCLTHAELAGTVVYEEDPREGRKLLQAAPTAYQPLATTQRQGPPGWLGPIHRRWPDYLDEYSRAAAGARLSRQGQALLFLHERATPSGIKYVVTVSAATYSAFDTNDDLAGMVVFRQAKRRNLVTEWRPVVANGPLDGARGKAQRRELRLSLPDHDRRVVVELRPDTPLDPPPSIQYGNRLRFFAGQPDPADASHFTIAYEVDGRPGTIDGWMRDDGLELKPREGAPTYTPDQGEAWKLPAASLPAAR